MISDKIKELRKTNNISQYELANIAEVSRSAVAKWEYGKCLPNDDSIAKICIHFGITREWLLENEEIINESNKREYRKKIIISIIGLIVSIVSMVLLNVKIFEFHFRSFVIIPFLYEGYASIFNYFGSYSYILFFVYIILFIFSLFNMIRSFKRRVQKTFKVFTIIFIIIGTILSISSFLFTLITIQ